VEELASAQVEVVSADVRGGDLLDGFGFACGELVADAILGRGSPQLELLDPARFS